MIKIKRFINITLCFVMAFLFAACSDKNNDSTASTTFVGIAVFQNSIENTKWESVNKDKTLINNIIETKDNKISYTADPAFLFYVYTQNEINSNTQDSEFISNTTKDIVSISNRKISFTFERIAEDTDILIYFIYKTSDGYFLKFIKEQSNISSSSETISLDIESDNFDTVELNLKVNLSVKEKY